MDCVRPMKIQNDDVDNDVIVLISVSSDSEVVSCFPYDRGTDDGYTCLPCGPQRFDCQFEKEQLLRE